MDTTLGLLGTSSTEPVAGNKAEQDRVDVGMSEAELELGLGLSLCVGGGCAVKSKGSQWGEFGRILTAKDFPTGFSSSVRPKSSNVSNTNVNVVGSVSGNKRAADSVGPTEVGIGSTSTGLSQVVGWPPIRAYRMNSLVSQSKTPNSEEEEEEEEERVGGNEKSNDNLKKKINKNDATVKEKGNLGFVKVNMDGLQIGRKVDLNAHGCYKTLAQTLEDMFFKPTTPISSIRSSGEKEQATQPSKLLDESSDFVLTYEDKDGDWMLVGDVPWGMFLSTAKRLRIMRTSEANGLAPRFQERSERLRSKRI